MTLLKQSIKKVKLHIKIACTTIYKTINLLEVFSFLIFLRKNHPIEENTMNIAIIFNISKIIFRQLSNYKFILSINRTVY